MELELGTDVVIKDNSKGGKIIGLHKSLYDQTRYNVRYVDNDGRIVEQWLTPDQIGASAAQA